MVLEFAANPGLGVMKAECWAACRRWLGGRGASSGCCAAETVDRGSCWASVGAPQAFWSTTVHATAITAVTALPAPITCHAGDSQGMPSMNAIVPQQQYQTGVCFYTVTRNPGTRGYVYDYYYHMSGGITALECEGLKTDPAYWLVHCCSTELCNIERDRPAYIR